MELQIPTIGRSTSIAILLFSLIFGSFASAHDGHIDDIEEIVFLDEEVELSIEKTEPKAFDLKRLIGRLHPVLVHFPIAFLLLAAGSEWCAALFKKQQARIVAIVTLWIGSISSILAAISGWTLASGKRFTGEDAELLLNHRWLGVSVVATAVITLGVFYFFKTHKWRDAIYLILLTILAVLVVLTGHYGGSLIYGAEYLSL